MILHFIALISFMLICPSWGVMISTDFDTLIEPICFDLNSKGMPYINGQKNPLASTLENFIALVEKFEIANPSKGLKEELYFFLKNFVYTNIEYNSLGDIVRWHPKQYNFEYMENLWNTVNDGINFDPQAENPFTEAEKCSLFFMISHSIIRNPRKMGEQRSPTFNNETKRRINKWGTEIEYDDDKFYPQEQGVVAIQGTEEAISLGRVLTGLYVGMGANREVDLTDIKRIPAEYIPEQGKKADLLYTLTVAEVIAMIGWRPEAGGRQYLAENGRWVSVSVGTDLEASSVCPMVYRLDDNTKPAFSYSSMRGAADGLILGKISREIEKKKRDVKLSQVLRQYYSRGGLYETVEDLGDIRASFCNREFFLKNWEGMIKEQVRLFVLLGSTNYKNVDDSITFAWNKYEEYRDKKGMLQNKNQVIKDYCGASLSIDRPEDLSLETPLDITAVINTGTNDEYIQKQQLIIGSLAKRLQLSYYGGRMTVFTDQKVAPSVKDSVSGNIQLRTIVDETYSSACAACSVTQMEPSVGGESAPEDEVILALNQYLLAKKQNETKYHGANGKVLILFNFDEDVPVGRPTNLMMRLEKALRDLHLNHVDVPVYALGKNMEVLKKYARNDVAFVMSAFDLVEDVIANDLYKKVVAAPARLQYEECKEGKGEKTAIFEDFITPNAIQHWSMPAEYFYKSINLKVSFESTYGQAKVCHSRSTVTPELQKDSCRDIETGKPLEFKHSNPCKGYTQYSCAPFYFSILGVNVTDEKSKPYCDDKVTENKCRTLDQIKFKVSHEGIRCSGSIGLFAAPIFVLFAIVVSHLVSKLA